MIDALEIRRPASVLFARGIGEAPGVPSRIAVPVPLPGLAAAPMAPEGETESGSPPPS